MAAQARAAPASAAISGWRSGLVPAALGETGGPRWQGSPGRAPVLRRGLAVTCAGPESAVSFAPLESTGGVVHGSPRCHQARPGHRGFSTGGRWPPVEKPEKIGGARGAPAAVLGAVLKRRASRGLLASQPLGPKDGRSPPIGRGGTPRNVARRTACPRSGALRIPIRSFTKT